MEKVKNDKTFIKIICISLAVILWFYVSYFENPTMTKTIRNVSVAISEEQLDRLAEKGLSVYSISTQSVDVKATAPRLSLAKLSNKTLSAYINVNSIRTSGTYTLPANVISDVTVGASYYVKGKNITVVVEPIMQSKFPIEADIDSNYVGYDTFELEDDFIVVTAPESILNKIATVKTNTISIEEKIESEIATFIFLDKDGAVIDNNLIKTAPVSMQVTFSYLKEKEVPVIVITSNGKSFQLPEENNITIYGQSDVLSKVSNLYSQVLNLQDIEDSSTVKVNLDIPDGINVADENKEIEIKIDSAYFN